ncbi:serine hydrolase domain-containing protein [Phenylobacterium sp.]|uniref:serine hydrolase domain-containing protein n=1 Tax=Phenylobacterium sp. TaxID=1871053 RepID=UPI0025CC04A9|nr:serine hydrolase domain-containing protein [Phenylobacterium sp.]
MTCLDRRGLLLGGAGLTAFAALPAFARITVQPPPAAGFTVAGVADLNAQMHALVDQQKLAGVVTLLARKGKVVNLDAYGKQDASASAPMAVDSIFRIASMTKPITGVAMMQLWEQGKWKLDDPVSRHIPEFAGLKVKTAAGLVDQTRPMTMAQLMSHTAGFGTNANYEPEKLNATDLRGMVDKLARLPLYSQPGADWSYGPCVNIQGYLVEKLSGQSLDAYFQQHIFTPLNMPDTQFWVSPGKEGRVVRIHAYADGKIVPAVGAPQAQTSKPGFLSGSGGLYSTAPDYYRFCQALLQGGELEGARILKPETVKLMRRSVLEPGVGVDLYGPVQKGLGFGMDFAVNERPAESGLPQGKDSYWWGGAFGTWFWIDPANDIVFVGMIQNLNGSIPGAGTPAVRDISPRAVYAALTDKKA